MKKKLVLAIIVCLCLFTNASFGQNGVILKVEKPSAASSCRLLDIPILGSALLMFLNMPESSYQNMASLVNSWFEIREVSVEFYPCCIPPSGIIQEFQEGKISCIEQILADKKYSVRTIRLSTRKLIVLPPTRKFLLEKLKFK